MSTIKDIAIRLGISDATVSRALTGQGYVSNKMAEDVFKVAKELNYKPNLLAVGLRTQKTRILSLVVPNIGNPIYINLVKYIEMFATRQGYSVILCNTDENIDKEKIHVEMLSSGLVAGVLLVPCLRTKEDDEYIHRLKTNKVVLFNRNIQNCNLPIVKSDHHRGIAMSLEHLVLAGKKRIGILIGDIRNSVARERLAGYIDGMAKCACQEESDLIKFGDLTEKDGFRMTMELINMKPPIDAIIISNNMLTKGSIKAIKQCSIDVPQQIMIVAVDDINNSDLIEPQLTYVTQPLYDMSKKAYDILIQKISSRIDDIPIEQQVILFPVSLTAPG